MKPLHFLSSMLIACGFLVQTSHAATLESLEERVHQYWEARIANDLVAMYDLEADSVQGQGGLQAYIKGSGNIAYNSAELENLELLDDETAVAQLAVQYRILALPGDWMSTTVHDTWILIDGKWYHFGRKPTSGMDAEGAARPN
jgi:hypothetical protein